MFTKQPTALTRSGVLVDPLALLGRMTSEFDRIFDEPGWPALPTRRLTESAAWYPNIDLFEKDNRLIARVDLPGLKKEDVKVEVADSRLTISGERKHETEEKEENFYRCEREYGCFYREIPLPEGAKLNDVKAAFEDGVLEVSVPLAARLEAKPRAVKIEESVKPAKAAT
jgi:HSP20 family protein